MDYKGVNSVDEVQFYNYGLQGEQAKAFIKAHNDMTKSGFSSRGNIELVGELKSVCYSDIQEIKEEVEHT